VITIEYDPNVFAHRVARVRRWREALHPSAGWIESRAKIVSGPRPTSWWAMLFSCENIPPGTTIHNIELKPGKGAQMVRRRVVQRSWWRKKASTLCEIAFRRNPQSLARLHGDDRTGR
jgi:ribosomal protein L2